jgi:hypothetical protein
LIGSHTYGREHAVEHAVGGIEFDDCMKMIEPKNQITFEGMNPNVAIPFPFNLKYGMKHAGVYP